MFDALSQPKYMRFWLGSLAAVGGTQLVMVAQSWLIVKELGGSGVEIGFVGGVTAVPAIIVSLFGGVLADRIDRRVILIVTSAITTALLAVLAVLDATDAVQVWHVMVISAGVGLVTGFDWPARGAFFPQLISKDQMSSAVTLNTIMWQGTRIVAPAIGGVLIATLGTEAVFFASAGGFAAMTVVVSTLKVPRAPARPRRNVGRELAEGVQFIWRTPLFRVLIPLTYANMFFGMQYIPLMVLFSDEFGVGPNAFGWMLTMLGVGAVCGTVLANRLQAGGLLGRSMLAGTFVFTLFLIAFAFAPTYAAALPLIFCASFCNSIFMINSMTALQLEVPDQLRGRVMGMHNITFNLIPLGGLVGGVVADASDESWAIAGAAGVLALIVVYVAVTQRHIREMDGVKMAEARRR
jgi:MFS family permease